MPFIVIIKTIDKRHIKICHIRIRINRSRMKIQVQGEKGKMQNLIIKEQLVHVFF